jgi:hypothetical protein
MKLWKALGLAGLAGVATTGAIIARNQRQRAQLTPDQIRERLHQRVEAAQTGPTQTDPAQPGPGSTDSSARA